MLTIADPTRQLGTIPNNLTQTIVYEVRNNSDQPIEVTQFGAGCGCTTPSISVNPIPANGTANFVCGFTPNSRGTTHKSAWLKTFDQKLDVYFSATIR